MSMKPPPPDIVIGRLPIYLRALETLAQEGQEVTSSYELGERLGVSSAQIRKDLALFGDFGKQGTGYLVNYLLEQLRHILNLDREWQVVVIGAGHVGGALVNYPGFAENGFKISALFDADPQKVGKTEAGYTIRHVDEAADYIQQNRIKIAMIATPANAAQDIVDQLISAGIQCILSYAPTTLMLPEGVYVQYIDPVSKLQQMAYYINDDET